MSVASAFELRLAQLLGARTDAPRGGVAGLMDAHSWLQQAICDAPPNVRLRHANTGHIREEEWSVRKAMRLSIWHLRYRTAALAANVNRIWLSA
jgi:hypothetical protein